MLIDLVARAFPFAIGGLAFVEAFGALQLVRLIIASRSRGVAKRTRDRTNRRVLSLEFCEGAFGLAPLTTHREQLELRKDKPRNWRNGKR